MSKKLENENKAEKMALAQNENICRLCLIKMDPEDSSPVSIFDDDCHDRPVSDVIFDCLRLKVIVDEPLPRIMCEQCFAKLGAFSNFKLQCLSNDSLLRESLSSRRAIFEEEASDEGDGRSSPKREVRSPPSKKKLFDCDVCKKTFTSKFSLRRHMDNYCKPGESKKVDDRSSERESNGNFACDVCEKSFTSKYSLGRHVDKYCIRNGSHRRKRTGESFVCNICNKSYRRKIFLERHMIAHDDSRPAEAKSVPCERCGRIFANKNLAYHHVRTFHERKTVAQCAICERKFVNSSSLKTHMNTHTRNNLYECAICAKRLASNHSLKNHMLTHTGEKPFPCRFCDASFRTPSQVKMHERRHTGEVPYKCPLCDKRTVRLEYLKEHFARHHEGVRFYDVYKKYDRREVQDY